MPTKQIAEFDEERAERELDASEQMAKLDAELMEAMESDRSDGGLMSPPGQQVMAGGSGSDAVDQETAAAAFRRF